MYIGRNQNTYQPTNAATNGITVYAFQLDMNVVTPCPTTRDTMEVLAMTGLIPAEWQMTDARDVALSTRLCWWNGDEENLHGRPSLSNLLCGGNSWVGENALACICGVRKFGRHIIAAAAVVTTRNVDRRLMFILASLDLTKPRLDRNLGINRRT